MTTEVRIICLAEFAYAAIKGNGYSLDVRLDAGKAPVTSLYESAEELEARAAQYLKTAERIRAAAFSLHMSRQLNVKA